MTILNYFFAYSSVVIINLAGTPPHTSPAGICLVTILPAATIEFAPTEVLR